MQILKWFAIPTFVLVAAATLAITGWFGYIWVSVFFATFGVVTLFLWRRATCRLTGSIENVDSECLNSEGQRTFTKIFAVTFGSSCLLMLGALIVLLLVPAARTASGFAFAFTVMVWCSMVKFGAMNVLAHYFLPTSHPK